MDDPSPHIEMLGHLRDLGKEVRTFAHRIGADFLNVRYDNGLVITRDAGQIKLTGTEIPGALTLAQLETCLAAWNGDIKYDCADQGHIVGEGGPRCMMCGRDVSTDAE